MAVLAFVLGLFAVIGGLFCLIPGPICGIPAVILGLVSQSRLSAGAGGRGGSGLALAGWICGIAGILVAAIFSSPARWHSATLAICRPEAVT
jgi:hypothetical protein